MGRYRINLTDEMEKKAPNLLLSLVPKDGSAIGNFALRRDFLERANRMFNGHFGDDVYWQVRKGLIESGQLERGRGKGGSVRLAAAEAPRREKRTRRGEEKT